MYDESAQNGNMYGNGSALSADSSFNAAAKEKTPQSSATPINASVHASTASGPSAPSFSWQKNTNTNLNNTRENITLNKAQEYKNSNKAQEKAYKDYTRNDFKNDNDYERFLTENKVSLTSGNALNYINKKAQEQGVSARDFAKGMHTKVNNTLETEKLEQKAKNGELSNNDMNSLSQFHAYVDSNNNVIDDEKLQSQADLYKNTVDTINNDVSKLNEQYQKGKISVDADSRVSAYFALFDMLDDAQKLVYIDRFDEIFVYAYVDGSQKPLFFRVSRKHDDGRVWGDFFNALCHIKSIDNRH